MVDTCVKGVYFVVLPASQMSRNFQVSKCLINRRTAVIFKLYQKHPVYCGLRGYNLHICDSFERYSHNLELHSVNSQGTKCVKKRLRLSRGSVLAFGTQVRGFAPGRSRRIFRAKNPSFGGEVKPSVPCRSFTACKISLNVTCKSAFRQNYRTFLVHSSTFRRWVLSRGDTRGDAW
jgi:hypothetical protein